MNEIEQKMYSALAKIDKAVENRSKKRMDILNKIKAKSDNITALIIVGQSLLKNDYKLPKTDKIGFNADKDCIGSLIYNNFHIITKDGYVATAYSIPNNDFKALNNFVDDFLLEFDKFEKSVYDYIDKL